MCGKDDTKIAVYNLEEYTESGIKKKKKLLYKRLLEENHKKLNNLVGSEEKIR